MARSHRQYGGKKGRNEAKESWKLASTGETMEGTGTKAKEALAGTANRSNGQAKVYFFFPFFKISFDFYRHA